MAEFALKDHVLEDQEITDYFDGGALTISTTGAKGPLVVTLAPNPEGADSDPQATVEKEDFGTGTIRFRRSELFAKFPENSLVYFFVWEFDAYNPAGSDPVLKVAGKFRVRPAAKPSITPGVRRTVSIDSVRITIDTTNFTIDEAA